MRRSGSPSRLAWQPLCYGWRYDASISRRRSGARQVGGSLRRRTSSPKMFVSASALSRRIRTATTVSQPPGAAYLASATTLACSCGCADMAQLQTRSARPRPRGVAAAARGRVKLGMTPAVPQSLIARMSRYRANAGLASAVALLLRVQPPARVVGGGLQPLVAVALPVNCGHPSGLARWRLVRVVLRRLLRGMAVSTRIPPGFHLSGRHETPGKPPLSTRVATRRGGATSSASSARRAGRSGACAS